MKNKLIFVILLFALFFRTYRSADLTGFYFDQGRDAKVIWELWHSGKTFLIGPTTGIEGIFLGPFYYYLIAPFYLLGNGNPVVVSFALALINVIGIYFIYLIGRDFFNHKTGILAAIFISFSLPLVQAHRWLSNPTPLPMFSALSLWLIYKITHGSKSAWSWLFLGLSLGLSLQLEAASATFFLPATVIIFIIYLKQINWSQKTLLLFFSFALTLVPQLWFNFRHDNILFEAFRRFLFTEKSFQAVLSSFYTDRIQLYFSYFSQKLFLDHTQAIVFSALFVFLTIFSARSLAMKQFGILIIWIFTPLLFLLFYHGNNGYVWDYYFTGIYSVFMLFIASVLASSTLKYKLLKPLAGLFVLCFVITNLFHLKNYLSAGLDGDTTVVMGTSMAAVKWVYQDAQKTSFNVDVYVPPVISHAYDYLFLWQGNTVYHTLPKNDLEPKLYLLYEVDPPHPERLQAWLDRQATYATTEAKMIFGGITVERRHRI